MKNQRGFTLIELMTAVTIMVVCVGIIAQVLIKQSQASSTQSLQRDMEESGRLALLDIARNVRLAGYGITPLAAFDFDRYACTTPGNAATCNGGAARRDRTDGPDELVLSYRDPSFTRIITGVTSAQITFAAPLKIAIPAGSVIELIGAGGKVTYLLVSTAAAVNDTRIVYATLPTSPPSAGYYTPSTAPDSTYVGANLTLVTRVRYYVANDTDGVPALYKNRGRGAELLYRGIEDVQYTFDIAPPPTGSSFASTTPPATCAGVASWTFGACAGTVSQPLETATPPDWQNDAYDSANRYTGHPANIRRVNISIVARATRASPDRTGDSVPVLGDRPARAADRFKRTVLQMSEQPMNLLTRQFFQPLVISGSDPNGNVGGG
jgi:prepilin-type N-terminal cleavage/methylation domain-containing protein